MSRKNHRYFIFNSILFFIVSSYVLILFIAPSAIAFCDPAAVFVKSDANIFLMIAGILFLIINTAVYLNILKKKIFKISALNGKQMSVQKKHPRKMPKDLIAGIIMYFLISNLIIIYSFLDTLFSRYVLTRQSVAHYNFLNQKTQSYGLKSFDDFEIGTQVYSSRTGTALYFYVETDGPVNLLLKKTHDRKQALELMAELKNSYDATINRDGLRWFQRKSGYDNWSAEDKKLFSDVFKLNF